MRGLLACRSRVHMHDADEAGLGFGAAAFAAASERRPSVPALIGLEAAQGFPLPRAPAGPSVTAAGSLEVPPRASGLPTVAVASEATSNAAAHAAALAAAQRGLCPVGSGGRGEAMPREAAGESYRVGSCAAPSSGRLGGGLEGPGVDVTVLAYAQWLSEVKHQATGARFQQKAEFEVLRDAVRESSSELADFKRLYAGSVQRLESQVTDLRSRLQDVVADLAAQTRQRQEAEVRQNTSLDTHRQSLGDNVQQLQAEVHKLSSNFRASDVGSIHKALLSSQEQTIAKFGDVDRAFNSFRNGIAGLRQEVSETKQDSRKAQDLLGQAISTLSQDFADFQKHTSNVMNKLQSDVYRVEEFSRGGQERVNRTEAQLAGIQQSVFSTANDMILLRSERGGAPTAQAFGPLVGSHGPGASSCPSAGAGAGGGVMRRTSDTSEVLAVNGPMGFAGHGGVSACIGASGACIGASGGVGFAAGAIALGVPRLSVGRQPTPPKGVPSRVLLTGH